MKKNQSTKGYILTVLFAFLLVAASVSAMFFGLAFAENKNLNQPFSITETKADTLPYINNVYENIYVLTLEEDEKYLSSDKYISEQFAMASIEKIFGETGQTLSGYGILSLEDYTVSIDKPITFWQAVVTSKNGVVYYIAINALDGKLLYFAKTNDYDYTNPAYVTRNFNLSLAKRTKSKRTSDIRYLLKGNTYDCTDFASKLQNIYDNPFDYDYDSEKSAYEDFYDIYPEIVYDNINFILNGNEFIQTIFNSSIKNDFSQADLIDTYINEFFGLTAIAEVPTGDEYFIFMFPFYTKDYFSGFMLSPLPYEKIEANSLYNPYLYFNYSFFFGQ